MIKKLTALFLAASFLLCFAACGSKPADSGEPDDGFAVAAMKGPTSIGMMKLIKDGDAEVSLYATADEITAGLVSGSFDAAALPCNLASVLYHNTDGAIKLAAVNTLGVLYLLEKGDTVSSVADLAGKTVYSAGKGTTPEYVLSHLLDANGVSANVEYKSEASEAAALFIANGGFAVLPQPYAASVLAKDSSVRIALDINTEWKKTENEPIVTGVFVVRTDYLEAHGDEFDSFLKKYSASCEYAAANIDETAAACVEYGVIASEGIAKAAIPYCNIKYIGGNAMKQAVNGYLNILFNANSASVGGEMPDDEFYYLG